MLHADFYHFNSRHGPKHIFDKCQANLTNLLQVNDFSSRCNKDHFQLMLLPLLVYKTCKNEKHAKRKNKVSEHSHVLRCISKSNKGSQFLWRVRNKDWEEVTFQLVELTSRCLEKLWLPTPKSPSPWREYSSSTFKNVHI